MRIVAFRPADEMWRRMKAVWDACLTAGINLPAEVERYFNGEAPDPHGVELAEHQLREAGAVRDWEADMCEGFEVDVSKLPPEVTVVRFYINY